MKLEDFEEASTSTFEDFETEDNTITNKAKNSINNKAIMSIALSGDPEGAAQNYSSALEEFDNTGNSSTLKSLDEQSQVELVKGAEESLVEGLVDPSVDDETKMTMVGGFTILKEKPISTQEKYIDKVLVNDGGEKTEEQVKVRSSMIGLSQPYFQNKLDVQKLINSHSAKLDSSTMVALGDMIELFLVPTAYNTHTKNVLGALQKAVSGEDTTGVMDFLLAGNARVDISRMIKSVPTEDRLPLQAALLNIINSEEGAIYLGSDNDFAKFEMMTSVVSGEYTTGDQVVDNITGILDLIPFVSTIAMGFKSLSRMGDATKSVTVGASNPASAGRLTLENNPLEGFTMVEEAVKNEDVAKTLFGTDSKGVAVEAFGPKPMSSVGTVDPIPNSVPTRASADIKTLDRVDEDGQIYLTVEEKISAVQQVETSFQAAVGLKYNNAKSQIGYDEGLHIKAVYTAGDSGFSSAADARDQVKFALKEYGITDQEITILKRDAEGYNKPENLDLEGDYIVQVDYKTKINPNDVSNWSELDVKHNIFDRVGVLVGKGKLGSLQRHLLDAHSMLNRTLTLSANVAVDKGSLISRKITDLGEDFSSAIRTMDDGEKTQIDNYIKAANKDGFEDTPVQLMAKGFTPEGVKAIVSWRKSWDTVYWLENADLVKTLRAGGFKSLKTDTDNLLVRKKQINFSNNRVYNPETKKLQNLSPDEMRKLYDEGGYVGQSRSKLQLDGEHIDNVLVKNSSKSYTTALRETEPVLNYRKGYYQVNYDAPVFIDKIIRDKNGKELYKQAVGMARDNVEAKLMRTKWAKAEGKTDEDYGVVRENKNSTPIDSEDQFNMQMAQGRSSQRVRGERLQEATQPLTGGIDGTLVQDPIDALTHAAHSIGNRVSMRDWLETSKARFVEQYGDYIPEIKGQKTFPRTIDDLRKEGETTSKQIADARTTWEYINYMEGGYINTIDEGIKGALRGIGNIMGEGGYGKGQRAMEWMAGGRGATSAAKGAAFQLYIGLNPARQILVQSHQMVRLASINPKYALGKMTTELASVQNARLTGKANDLSKFVMNSGQIEGIARSNLIKDSLTEITHQSKSSVGGKVKGSVVRAANLSQKVGFEFGESNNVITSLLSFRDQAIKAGKDVNKASVRDEIYAQARNFTYNMTKAGDMPYNQNALGIVMQFLQVPHKAMTQTLFNRALSKKQKASALMFDAVMFGIPAYWAADMWFPDLLPEDPEVRDAFEIGLESMIFNSLINVIADEHSELDFTSLAPTSGQGFADLFVRLTEEGVGGLISKSPSGQLFLGNNPRVSNFVKDMAIFSGLMPEHTPITLAKLATSFVSMSSGMSNGFAMMFSQKYGKYINSSGRVIDDDVTSAEAIGLMFGLGTKEVSDYYKTTSKMYTKSAAFKDDVTAQYKNVKRQMTLAAGDKTAQRKVLETMALGWMVFGDDEPQARAIFKSLISRDAKEGDIYLIEQLFKMSGIMTQTEWNILVQGSNLPEDKQKELLSVGSQLQNFKNGED